MKTICFVWFLFSYREISSAMKNESKENSLPYAFVAAVVDLTTFKIVATGAVISPNWILTSAHLFPQDSKGINAKNYYIIAGHPLKEYKPSFAITHPAYTWGLYTSEDFVLIYVTSEIAANPISISKGRFPWNSIDCEFIYWKKATLPNLGKNALLHFKIEICVIQNCWAKKGMIPTGLLEYYLQDTLCGTVYGLKSCVGNTGGLLLCENHLTGMLIRREWCDNKTANFTDIGCFSNWLHSRVEDGQFMHVSFDVDSSANTHQCKHLYSIAVLPIIFLFSIYLY